MLQTASKILNQVVITQPNINIFIVLFAIDVFTDKRIKRRSYRARQVIQIHSQVYALVKLKTLSAPSTLLKKLKPLPLERLWIVAHSAFCCRPLFSRLLTYFRNELHHQAIFFFSVLLRHCNFTSRILVHWTRYFSTVKWGQARTQRMLYIHKYLQTNIPEVKNT